MTSKLTREELLNIIETDHVQCGEASALARIALAVMDSEPVADVVAWSHPTEERTCDIRWRRHDVEPGPLYRHAQPAPVVVPEGLNPETTDLVLRFASALADKLYKAEQKYGRSTDWMKDDWYDDCLQSLWEHIEKGDPRDVAAYCAFMWYHGWVTTDYDRNVQNACRAAMLQAGTLTNEDTKQAWTGIPDIDNAINMLDRIDTLESCDDDRIEAVKTVLRRLAGNSPAIPDGYVMVPKEPTAEMIWAAKDVMSSTVGWESFKLAYIAMLAAAPQEVK